VHLSLQAVYCLGSKVKVLTTLSDDCAIIAFKNEHADQILQLLHDKGIVLKQLCSSLFIRNMKKCSILWRGPGGHDWIYNYLCNQCLSPLKL
jgi:hypothetical protein